MYHPAHLLLAQAAVGEAIAHDRMTISCSDAGAHLIYSCDADFGLQVRASHASFFAFAVEQWQSCRNYAASTMQYALFRYIHSDMHVHE